MNFLVTFFYSLIAWIRQGFSKLNIQSVIYDSLITKPLTKYTYYRLYDQMKPHEAKCKRILDVGTGTGEALHAIYDKFSTDTFMVGIDIDKNYIKKATELFKDVRNVRIREQNFYDLAETNEKYDAIIFSSSFMLMPDRERALDIAKSMLNPGGRIYFLMTLYAKKKRFVEAVKPYLKYYTTIDFGNITYENEFEELLMKNNLNVLLKERIYHKASPLLHLFRVFIVECQIKQLGLH